MPARKRRISAAFRSLRRRPLCESDWQQIERDYGWPIAPEIRKQIENATDIYEFWAATEYCGVPVTDIREAITSVLSAAGRLAEVIAALDSDVKAPSSHAKVILEDSVWHELMVLEAYDESDLQAFRKLLSKVPAPSVQSSPTAPLDIDGVLYRLIGRQMGSNCLDRRFAPQEALRLLGWVIPSLIMRACKTALHEVDDPTYKVIGGRAWRAWVRQLSEILQEHALPTGASKFASERSVFVSLVSQLQNRLPAPYRRHFHSDQALAKAITDARSPRYRDAKV